MFTYSMLDFFLKRSNQAHQLSFGCIRFNWLHSSIGNIPAIIGGAVGGLVGLILIVFLIVYLIKCKRSNEDG